MVVICQTPSSTSTELPRKTSSVVYVFLQKPWLAVRRGFHRSPSTMCVMFDILGDL